MSDSIIKRNKAKRKSKIYQKIQVLSLMSPIPPQPDPDPPTPDPPTPPTPGFTPWIYNPGNSILSSGYWINRTFTGGYSKIPDRASWGAYPGQQYNLPNGSTLPNCTGWTYGRVMYILGTTDSTAVPVYGNAGEWYGSTTWPKSQTPTLGAIACWGGYAGHVAVVEAIGHDSASNWNYIIVSESAYYNGYYNGNWWNFGGCQSTTIYQSNINRFTGYYFQGFINTPTS